MTDDRDDPRNQGQGGPDNAFGRIRTSKFVLFALHFLKFHYNNYLTLVDLCGGLIWLRISNVIRLMDQRFPRSFGEESMRAAMDVTRREVSLREFEARYPFFKTWYDNNINTSENESQKEQRRFSVFKELVLNLHGELARHNYTITVPVYKCFFEQVLATLQRIIKKNLDCMQAYEYFRGNILKFTLDDGWIHSHLFDKEDLELIFLVVYDCLLFKIEYYKIALSRKKCLDLVCLEPVEFPNPRTEALVSLQVLVPSEVPEIQEFLSSLDLHNQSISNASEQDQISENNSDLLQTIAEGAPFQIKTKAKLREELAQQEREKKIQAILDREMSKLVQEFNAKPLNVAK